ncbi:HEPN domain-containing protein [Variovorax sp. LjRoot84]|uniref:hypothetical protein n=1 Tax=Variovorax sp. LjRoot84 TaxID=3342340 RepID=UPI003ED03475
MELDGRLRDKLTGTLRTLLPTLGLAETGRLDVRTAFDIDKQFSAALRGAPNALKAQIDNYLGERPLMPLLLGMLTEDLRAIATTEKIGKTRLCELDQYKDVESLATRFVDMLAAMPREYLVSIDLPQSLTRELYRSSAEPIIGRQLAVLGTWHEKVVGFPDRPIEAPSAQPPRLGLLGAAWPPTQQPEVSSELFDRAPPEGTKSFLYVKLKGYIDSYYPAQPLDRFTTLFKAFVGLGLGIELLEAGWDALTLGPVKMTMFERSAKGFTALPDDTVDDSAGDLFRRIRLHARGRRRVVQKLRSIVHILDMDEGAPQLMLAGRWLFDSRANRDAVMGFMQLAICAEVLLGTEDGGEGVIGMLAARCAYLIASSAKERESLAAEFKNIYKVRSKIVHRGLGAFKENERGQYQRLRTICNRILQKEMELALADGPAQQEAAQQVKALREGAAVLTEVQRKKL